MSLVIDALSRWRLHTPCATALSDGAVTLSYRELALRVRALASKFAAADCRCIAILADNGIDWVVADLAALASRATVIPVPPFFTRAQAVHLLGAAPVDTLLVDDAARVPAVEPAFVRVAEDAGGLAMYRRPAAAARSPAVGSAAKITFTSGSTGEPKGVCLSRAGLEQTAGSLAATLRHLHIRRHLCVLPLATLLENVAGVYAPLMLGAAVAVPPVASVGVGGSSFLNARQLRGAIECVRAESVILLPQMLRELTRQCAGSRWQDNPLRFAAVGGGCVAEADMDAAVAAGIPAFQGYGLSECNSVVALNHPGAERHGSVGRLLPGFTMDVAVDGELLVRGPVMLGYLGDARAAGGVVRTGDLGRVDEDGYVYVTGRKKSMFITSFGRNVCPEWPEAELLHQPEIAQAVVDGEARPASLAIVVPSHAGIGAQELAAAIARANDALPDYARIADWIVADGPFTPANGLLTSSGKPRREAVLRRYLPGGAERASRAYRSLPSGILS